ncbi:MAG: hypothetical protein HY897_17035 [Deltaproteobacteria bacterium]|nr:hypothetical protein [Deltaproteobacteria bacterium]
MLHRFDVRAAALLSVALFTAGCGGGAIDEILDQLDGSVDRDSGRGGKGDAGKAEDGGTTEDGGSAFADAATADAPVTEDGATGEDGGPDLPDGSSDTSEGSDVSTESDAGSEDGGTETDAGGCKAGGEPCAVREDCCGGLICPDGTCQPSVCGDGFVDPKRLEECDDKNGAPGDGCEINCKFTCLSTDSNRNCASANPCVEDGTCDDAVAHLCAAGEDKADGTACGSSLICLDGTCGTSVCGDDYVDTSRGEECEDGNSTSGDGCEPVTCTYSCENPASDCAAAPACRKNACTVTHTCETVADPTQNGNICGNGLICDNGDCEPPPQVCPNGTPEAPEECDDGNMTPGDGCENNCTYSCHNPGADCASAPVCNAAVCIDVMVSGTKVGQRCSTVPANEGLSVPGCDAPNTCKNGACTPPATVCGNGVTESGEQCDFGQGFNLAGSGCEPNCQFTCAKSPDSCPDANPCNGTEVCSDVSVNGHPGQKCSAGTPLPEGSACGAGSICLGGSCVLSQCGDGYTDAGKGEQCDFGQGFNLAGSGCEPNCHFSCTKAPDSCPDTNPCNGTEVCSDVAVNGHPGQKCNAGTPLTLGASCGAGNLICVGNPLTCEASRCGDGYVDPNINEQCEPPGAGQCDANCHTIQQAVCGDKVLAASEQCDDNDGTPANLDGCDAACKYEMVLRMNNVSISGNTAPTGCSPTTNAFGRNVLTSTARSQLNTSLQDGVNAGDTNVILQMLGIDDLTGVNDPALEIGIMTGDLDPARGAWPGNNPIDWWYLISPTNLDANDLPNSKFTTAAIVARAITAGPNDVTMSLLLGGSAANLQMRSSRVFATVDNPPAPNTPAPPPTLLAAGTLVMQSINATASGKGLCGNITVESLSLIPIPEVLTTGTTACSSSCAGTKSYTYCGSGQPVGPSCNSMLDAIVGGCKVDFIFPCVTTVINSTQPDVAGSGYQGTLTLGAGNKVPLAQSQGNTRAYSSFLNFTANRGHATGRMP